MMRTVVLPRSVPQTARCLTGQSYPCAFPLHPSQASAVWQQLISLRGSPAHMLQCTCRDDILQGQGQGSELVWSKSTTHSFTASHLIAPSTSWTGALAPPTPEKLPFRTAIPALLATRQGSTASKLLGPQEVSPRTFLSLLQAPHQACSCSQAWTWLRDAAWTMLARSHIILGDCSMSLAVKCSLHDAGMTRRVRSGVMWIGAHVQVLGDYHSNLPAWADLPSNDRSSSQDLDEVSFQVACTYRQILQSLRHIFLNT